MGMLDINYNYKNKYNPNLKCRVCNEQDESNKHVQIIEQIIKIRDEFINKQTKTTSINDELGTTEWFSSTLLDTCAVCCSV